MFALLPRTWKTLNRSHWQGLEEALCDQGLPACVNNVFKYSVRLWILLQLKKATNARAKVSDLNLSDASDEAQHRLALPDIIEEHTQENNSQNDAEQQKKQWRTKAQSKTLRFVNNTTPTPRTVYCILRNVTSPSQILLHKKKHVDLILAVRSESRSGGRT